MGAAWWVVVLGCAGAAFVACDGSVELNDADAAESESTAASTGGVGAAASGPGGAGARGGSSSVGAAGGGCQVVECVPVGFSFETQCNDCIDNDGDGLTDLEDPPCFAPWAFSESNFTGEVGDDVDPCRLDCAFDQDFGSGNDECEFDLKCDALGPLAPECPFDPTKTCPAPKAACLEFCVPLAPNGCDCFGCCELPARSGQFVYVDGWACTIDGADPMGCSPCTPHAGCINPCDECEICFGDLALPDGCVVQACPEGRAACGQACQPACGADEYCLGGCCAPAPNL